MAPEYKRNRKILDALLMKSINPSPNEQLGYITDDVILSQKASYFKYILLIIIH